MTARCPEGQPIDLDEIEEAARWRLAQLDDNTNAWCETALLLVVELRATRARAERAERLARDMGWGYIHDEHHDRVVAQSLALRTELRAIVDLARECERCDGQGSEPTIPGDACRECGGTGEYAIVATIPDIRAALATMRDEQP